MAKQQRITAERLIYCSGSGWEGGGSKDSSPCPFGESMITSAERFKCSYCGIGTKPSNIYADKNGVIRNSKEKTVMNDIKAPEKAPVVTPASVTPSVPASEQTGKPAETCRVDLSNLAPHASEGLTLVEESPVSDPAPKKIVTKKTAKKPTKKVKHRRLF